MDWSQRAMAINNALKRPHLTTTELELAANRTATLNELWRESVNDDKSGEQLILSAYPHYPKELAQAIVKTLVTKATIQEEGDAEEEEHQQEQCNKKWKYWEDVEKEKIKGLTSLATKRMDQLELEETEEGSQPSKRKRAKKNRRKKEKEVELQF